MIVEQGTTLIRRLRVTTADRDRKGLQQKFSLALSSANFQPAGLPPSYIVCIRRLRAAMPRLSGGKFPTAELCQAVGTSIAEISGTGVRPAKGIVPDSARAVIFTDKAELLECLARDWCEDRHRAHWWWRSFFGKLPTAEDVKEFCKASPQYFPAGLQHLALLGKAVQFVRRFSNGEALELSQSIARSFALPGLGSVLGRLSEHDPESLPQLDPRGSRSDAREPSLETLPRAPWKSCVPEADADGLTTGQQLLLGVSLLLLRAPATVRARAFGRHVDSWMRAKTCPDVLGSGSKANGEGQDQGQSQQGAFPPERDAYVSRGPTALIDNLASLPDKFSPESAPIVSDLWPSDAAAARAPERLSDWIVDGSAGNTWTSASDEMVTTSTLPNQAITLSSHDAPATVLVRDEESDGDKDQSRIALESASFGQDQWAAIEVQTETQFGGLFYLINLALYLDLYGDFTAPTELGIPLNIWDFVALVGRELLGDRIQNDPIWRLLAVLAGRDEDTAPGHDFEPEDQWRVPQEWLLPFLRQGRCQWTTGGGRLRLFHPCQFALLDIPLVAEGGPDNAKQQLQHEMGAYQDFQLEVSSEPLSAGLALQLMKGLVLPDPPGTRPSQSETGLPVRLWLDRLMPYLHARLHNALGAKATEDPVRIFGGHARVVATATHLDIFLALADLPIEIRISGLDRNPGWVPVAGRFVAFHFD